MIRQTSDQWKLLLAQFGPRENRAKSRALLLSAEELPGVSWIEYENIVIRIGVFKRPRSAWSARARKAGRFSAFRLHRQPLTRSKISLQAWPMMSNDDALLMLSTLDISVFSDNPDFHGSDLEHREVSPLVIHEIESSREFLHSWETNGLVNFMRTIHLVDGSIVLAARFIREGQPWTDSEMLEILELQRLKLKG